MPSYIWCIINIFNNFGMLTFASSFSHATFNQLANLTLTATSPGTVPHHHVSWLLMNIFPFLFACLIGIVGIKFSPNYDAVNCWWLLFLAFVSISVLWLWLLFCLHFICLAVTVAVTCQMSSSLFGRSCCWRTILHSDYFALSVEISLHQLPNTWRDCLW